MRYSDPVGARRQQRRRASTCSRFGGEVDRARTRSSGKDKSRRRHLDGDRRSGEVEPLVQLLGVPMQGKLAGDGAAGDAREARRPRATAPSPLEATDVGRRGRQGEDQGGARAAEGGRRDAHLRRRRQGRGAEDLQARSPAGKDVELQGDGRITMRDSRPTRSATRRCASRSTTRTGRRATSRRASSARPGSNVPGALRAGRPAHQAVEARRRLLRVEPPRGPQPAGLHPRGGRWSASHDDDGGTAEAVAPFGLEPLRRRER